MRHLDLFSGIGGFALAASCVWPDHEIVSFCEIEPFCQKVLKKHWPNVPCHDDIKTMDGGKLERIDLLTGGYPCQPFSTLGQRKGHKDDRHLWPEMLRIVKQTSPAWVVAENVYGHINLGLDRVINDLESAHYTTWAVVIPACAVGAPHRRDRVWVIANSTSIGLGEYIQAERCDIAPDIWRKWQEWSIEPTVDRKDDGLPNRTHRIKSLGNAIVPQVAAQIMMAIKQTDEQVAKAE